MLDEMARRKSDADISQSEPIRLADGQVWYFPKPWLEIRPSFLQRKASSARTVMTYDDELDQLIKDIGDCTDDASIVAAIASLGAYMLDRAYQLSDADFEILFRYRVDDADSLYWAKTIMDVATGHTGPKVSSGGYD